MKRTITLCDGVEFQDNGECLKYLSTWARQMYDKVLVMKDGRHDLLVSYTNSETGQKFTMGAIWDQERRKYSFHS